MPDTWASRPLPKFMERARAINGRQPRLLLQTRSQPHRSAKPHANCNHMGYTDAVAITGFRHKGLERFFATGVKSEIQAKNADRLRLILGLLNVATATQDMDLPGLDLHQLRGARKGTWPLRSAATGASHSHVPKGI